jgi:hypothetical protein
MKALGAVLNDQPLEDCLSIAIAKKRVVLALANIQADYQVLGGAPNPLLELTELHHSATLNRVHGNLLLAVKRLWVRATLSYQEVTALSAR